ncbi:hypothetical protein BD414DRAFT_439598 [Trametes punicea]|nr:hypothetical protein BD414DRAFT_439598 [Trametes punicea]
MSAGPAPLRGDRPPAYRMVTRVYKSSLRPVVIVLGTVAAIWSLIWWISSFQNISVDRDNGQPKLAVFDIVLGIIYISACAMDVFGVIAAATQRLALVRLYTFISVVASLAIIAAGFLQVVLHFVFKSGLIAECEQIAQGQGVEVRFGIWSHRFREKLTPQEASTFCNDAWNRDSLNEIVYLIFEIIFSVFFTFIAFAYYQQVLDPTSAANQSRAPAAAGDGFPYHYNRPYEAEPLAPPYEPYDAPEYQPRYAPPSGPPPAGTGYGVGMGMDSGASEDKDKKMEMHDDEESETTKFGDPFADFDAPSMSKKQPGSDGL